MVTFLHESVRVSVPDWVVDLASFRRWTDTDDFPEIGRIWYLKGEVWVDISKEQLFSHNQVKLAFVCVLGSLTELDESGLFLMSGAQLANVRADICGNPDGLFVSYEALRTKRITLVPAKEGGYDELEGSPDMVLEIVSRSSEEKDRVILRRAYWEAGIREYWLADARKEPLAFDILRHTVKGYKATRKQDGWIKSAVFGMSFRLTQHPDALGHPEYTLAVR